MTRGSLVSAFIIVWLAHALIALALALPIARSGRTRVRWKPWELLAVVIPFLVWIAFMTSALGNGRKSLSNLIESVFLSFMVPLAALVRIRMGSRVSENAIAGILIAGLCVLAAGVFWLTPALPE